MIFMGIDPGQKGGIALLENKICALHVMDMDEIEYLLKATMNLGERFFVYLEKSQSMPGNKASAMFNYGVHNGIIMGLLKAFKVPYELVPPQKWMRIMHAGVQGKTTKEKSIKAVQRLFPGTELKDPAKPRSKKAHDGMAEALLIAEYGRRQWMKQ